MTLWVSCTDHCPYIISQVPCCLNTCSLKGDLWYYQSDWKVDKAKKHMLRDTFLKTIVITQCSKLRFYFVRPSGAFILKLCAQDFSCALL